MLRLNAIVIGAAVAAACGAASAQTAADFAQLPGVFNPTLSADGRYLALGCQAPDRSRVCLYDLDGGADVALFGVPEPMTLDHFYFAGPQHLFVRGRFMEGLQTGAEVEDREFRRALVFNLETGASTPFMENFGGFDNTQVASLNRSDPGTVLAEITLRVGGGEQTGSQLRTDDRLESVLFEVGLDTGDGRRIDQGRLWRRIFRPDGEVSAHILFDPETSNYELRRVENGRQTLYEGEHPFDAPAFTGFDAEGAYVMVFPEGPLRGVRRIDPQTGEMTALTPEADGRIFAPIVDPHTEIVVGLQRYEDDLPAQAFFDQQLARDASALAGALGVTRVSLESWSRDRDRIVFSTNEPGRPARYFLYERSAGSVSPVGSAYPGLDEVALGTVMAVDYEAADGLTIPAFVTLPPGRTAEDGPFPLVVMPHGGPHARDDLQFHWWAQAYAARGYAVLQPNFRGSDGYGPAFFEAGFGEFGGLMIQDMLDGAEALRAAGVARDGPACFAGGSYGGYAALMAAIRAPQDVACVIAVNAVTRPVVILGDASRERRRGALAFWERYIGDRFMDAQTAAAISPLLRADAIAAPVLLIHGEADAVVEVEDSRLLAAALSERSDVTYLELPAVGHDLQSAAARQAILERSAALLDEALQ